MSLRPVRACAARRWHFCGGGDPRCLGKGARDPGGAQCTRGDRLRFPPAPKGSLPPASRVADETVKGQLLKLPLQPLESKNQGLCHQPGDLLGAMTLWSSPGLEEKLGRLVCRQWKAGPCNQGSTPGVGRPRPSPLLCPPRFAPTEAVRDVVQLAHPLGAAGHDLFRARHGQGTCVGRPDRREGVVVQPQPDSSTSQ